MGKKKTIHIISNTHWDREWRFPFEETRWHLIKLVDSLLELMERDPDYKYFNFDSQSIVLEDYLEYRPENRDRLRKLIEEGRLVVGPWYTLPEEFSVSGESLIRNLLMGKRVCDSFGKTSKVGYTPTSYGQISQLPQIYNGFGIDGMMFYRGIYHKECTNEYFWEGADGTQILGIRLSRQVSRGAFFIYVSHRTMHDPDWMGFRWGEAGSLPFQLCRADADHEEEPVIIRSSYAETCNLDLVEAGIKQAMEDILSEATTDCLVLFDGMDSTYPNKNLPKILEKANEINPDWNFIHSSLPDFLADLKAQIEPQKLTVLQGERRHPSPDNMFNAFLKDSLSSRMYIKQRNAEVERMLMQWAEPFACIAELLTGMKYPFPPLGRAWKILLSCHPHDSIGGLSPDQIHKDMMARFDQAEIIGKTLIKQALAEIVSKIETSDAQATDVLISVFNPSPFERNEIPLVFVDFPREKEYRSFSIFDPEGKQIGQQIIAREDSYLIATEAQETPMTFYTTKWKIAFEARHLPPLGYKTFVVRPNDGVYSNYGTQLGGQNTVENEFLRVKVQSDGTLSVFDKINRNEYEGLLYFEDCGEAGDPWMHIKPFADRTYYSIGLPVQIQLLEDGPLLTTFSIKVVWSLAAQLDRSNKQRSKEEKEIVIISKVTLKKGNPKLHLNIFVDNTVKDHRLRVMFNCGFRPQKAFAHGQFDMVEREVHLPDTSHWLENVTGTNPQLGTVCVENGERGMAVYSFGLTEYEVLENNSGTIALTLLRGFGYPKMSGLGKEDRVVRVGNEDSQCLGSHEYDLALSFYKGNWSKNAVLRREAEHKYAVLAVQHGRYAGKELTKSEAFLQIEPQNLILSALKKSENGAYIIVRLYNPTEDKIRGKLWTRFRIAEACLLNPDESIIEKLLLNEVNKIEVLVARKKIMTIGLKI